MHSMSWERWQTVNQFWTFVYLYNKDYQGLFQKCQRRKVNEHQKLNIHEKLKNLNNEKLFSMLFLTIYIFRLENVLF